MFTTCDWWGYFLLKSIHCKILHLEWKYYYAATLSCIEHSVPLLSVKEIRNLFNKWKLFWLRRFYCQNNVCPAVPTLVDHDQNCAGAKFVDISTGSSFYLPHSIYTLPGVDMNTTNTRPSSEPTYHNVNFTLLMHGCAIKCIIQIGCDRMAPLNKQHTYLKFLLR